MQYFHESLKNDRIISIHFQGKPFNIMVIQVYALTSNAEEAEVERFYEDLQDLLQVTPKKDVLFIGLEPTRLLCPWNFPGKNTGVGHHGLHEGIFPTQGSNPCTLRPLHGQAGSLPLCHRGSPLYI